MFDSLEDQIRQDERATTTTRERVLRYVVIAAASVVAFGGLFYAVWMLT